MKLKEEIVIDTIIKRNEALPFSKMDDEVVMLSIQNSEYYSLNAIGGRIWEIIENPKSVEDIINILLEEYDVKKEECMKDIMPYIEELIEKSVILVADSE